MMTAGYVVVGIVIGLVGGFIWGAIREKKERIKSKYFVELWTLNRGKYSRTGLKTGGKYEQI